MAADPHEPPSRQYIDLPGHAPNLPFHDAVLVGDTLYLSGRIGLDPLTGQLPASLDHEMRFLFEGFAAVLRQAGMQMDDLVSVQIFCPDPALWQRFNLEYVKHFQPQYLPARAFLGSGPLLFGAHFEMMGIAVKRKA